jgi:hypothetical protein
MKEAKNDAAPSKKDFILSRGSMPARDIVDAAKKEGLNITTAYVYVVRSEATTKRAKGKPGKAKSTRNKVAKRSKRTRKAIGARATRSKPTAGGPKRDERLVQFVDLALDIGLTRADSLLQRLRGMVTTLTAA